MMGDGDQAVLFIRECLHMDRVLTVRACRWDLLLVCVGCVESCLLDVATGVTLIALIAVVASRLVTNVVGLWSL
jgi:hypothetical protein